MTEKQTVNLTINGEEVEAPAGEMLIKVCHDRGLDVPFFCYHPGLVPEGNCRMCLVEVVKAPKPMPACTTPVTEGMEIETHSEPAKAARSDVLEFMLANHPLDCPICDKSGECMLQDNSYAHGNDASRMVDVKQLKPTKELGNGVRLWGNRCISCTRCVRFCSDIAGSGELTMVNRGDRSVVDAFPGYPLQNPLSGNVVDICPVGALISEDFLYQARVWYEKKTDSVCHECSRGCNVEIQTLHNEVKRIVARHNDSVNDYWICDHGRYTYDYVLGPERALEYRLDDSSGPADAPALLARKLKSLVDEHGADSLGVLASAFMSNETLYLLGSVLKELDVPVENIAACARADGKEETFKGGFKISADRNPNRRGVEAILGPSAFSSRAEGLLEKSKGPGLRGLVLVSDLPGQPLPAEWIEALNSADFGLVFLLENDSRIGEEVSLIPATAFSERDGSIINEDGRIQLVQAATQLPRGALRLDDLLQDVLVELGAREGRISQRGLFDEMAAIIPALKGARHAEVGKTGLSLDGGEE